MRSFHFFFIQATIKSVAKVPFLLEKKVIYLVYVSIQITAAISCTKSVCKNKRQGHDLPIKYAK